MELELETRPIEGGGGDKDNNFDGQQTDEFDAGLEAQLARLELDDKRSGILVLKNQIVLDKITKLLPTEDLLTLRETCTFWNRAFAPKLASQHKPIHLHTNPYRVGRVWGTQRQLAAPSPSFLISDFTNSMEATWGRQSSSACAQIGLGGFSIYDVGMCGLGDINSFFGLHGQILTRLLLEIVVDNNMVGPTFEMVRQIVFDWAPELRELTLCPTSRTEIESSTIKSESEAEAKLEDELPPPQTLKKEIHKLRKFTVHPFSNGFDHRPCIPLFEDILQSAVGLESLSLDGEAWNTDILQMISDDGFNFPALSRLKSLKIWQLKARHLRHLIHLATVPANPLRISELKISIVSERKRQGAEDDEMIALTHRFLDTQSKTLRRLDISVEGYNLYSVQGSPLLHRSRFALLLPRMDHLHSLILQRTVNWQFAVQCECDDDKEAGAKAFENNFPALKQLGFSFDKWGTGEGSANTEAMVFVPLDRVAHEGVTSLKIDMQDQDGQDETREPPLLPLSVLAQPWSSVSSLNLKLRPATFKLLDSFWTVWPGLVSFRVELAYISYEDTTIELDELLTGIPCSKFAVLRKHLGSGRYHARTLENLRALQAKFKTKPGITDLGQLQEFVLDAGQHPFVITDIGGYLGLAMMPSQAVQHIALIHRIRGSCSREKARRTDCEENEISADCRSFMRSVFGPYAALDF